MSVCIYINTHPCPALCCCHVRKKAFLYSQKFKCLRVGNSRCSVPSPFPSFLFLPFSRPFPIKQFYSSIRSQHKESLDSEDFLNNPQPPGRWKRFLLLLPPDSANLHCVRALITLFVCRCFPLQEKYIRNRTSCITVNLAPKQYLVNSRRTMARQ